MKTLMYFAIVAAFLTSCSKNKSEMQNEDYAYMDVPVVEIIGEWIEIPDSTQPAIKQTPKKIKFNANKTMEGTPISKKVKKITTNNNPSDSIEVTTMIYQVWDKDGDTLTMISQSAIDPQLHDTITWNIVTLSTDSLKIHNKTQGTKNYLKNK